ncbi:MAG: tyrosine-type recombinase/integrase, partial [Acetivibrio ethanolgignens]
MSESIFKEVTLRRKEILNKVNPENVELAQSYLKYINISNFEKSTVSSKIQLLLHFLNYIHENLDDKLVTDITVSDMEDYLLYLGKCGLQPNSISTKMNGLSVFYKYLINKGVTMFNPIYYIPKPHKMKTEDNRHFLTREQIEILRDKLEENGDRTLQVYAFFSLSTAARVTAVSSVRWEQIDFEKRMVYKVKEKFSNYCTLIFSDYVRDLLL